MSLQVAADRPADGAGYLRLARQTRAWTLRQLAVDGRDARTGRSWRAYRRSSEERDYSDTWYDASQLWADAALARLGDAAAATALAPTVRHLAQHWDDGGALARKLPWRGAAGGFLGRGGIDGDWVGRPDKYADDNALVGVALLAAADALAAPAAGADLPESARADPTDIARADPTEAARAAPIDPADTARAAPAEPADIARAARANAAEAARCHELALAVGEYLVTGPLWDATLGGGWWWNTRRGDTLEGKPAQSNGLAALLFLRLHALTGEARWQEWAARTLAWCDARLWDDAAGLYRYCVRYAEPTKRRGEAVEQRYFNYDQGILLECLVALAARGDAAALARARTIAAALQPRFWDADVGGLVLEAGVPQVLLVYAAWLTPALVQLYAVDPDARWLALARRSHDALHARLHDAAEQGAYAHRAWRDEHGAVQLDPVRHTAAQAWMQHAQAALGAEKQVY